jgi:Uma2 family endonuclease
MSSGFGTQATRRYLRRPSPIDFPVAEEMPETSVHMRLRTALFLILERELRGRAFLGSDQFVYWDPTDPKACLAPDVLVRLGGPLELVPSFKVWLHGAPHLAVEVVSPIDARDKNLRAKLERYRRAAIAEVVIFDPDDNDEPLRLWDFFEGDLVERDRSDPAAFRCDALGAYWKLTTDEVLGPMLRVARDPEGTDLWLTPDEAERAAIETARADVEAARADAEAARARIAELEAKLRERG